MLFNNVKELLCPSPRSVCCSLLRRLRRVPAWDLDLTATAAVLLLRPFAVAAPSPDGASLPEPRFFI